MKKYVIYNKKSNGFVILNTIKEIDSDYGTGIGRAAKYSEGSIEVGDNVIGYVDVPKDNRGGLRSTSGF